MTTGGKPADPVRTLVDAASHAVSLQDYPEVAMARVIQSANPTAPQVAAARRLNRQMHSGTGQQARKVRPTEKQIDDVLAGVERHLSKFRGPREPHLAARTLRAVTAEAGRANNDSRLHAINTQTPAYALCGAGLIVDRYPGNFSADLDHACADCVDIATNRRPRPVPEPTDMRTPHDRSGTHNAR